MRRCRRILRPLVLVVAWAAAVCVPLAADEAAKVKKVLVFGIDGLRSDAFVAGRTPHLDGLMAAGISTLEAEIIGPRDSGSDTISGPAWSSILTGVWADKHGVTDNQFEHPQYGEFPDFFTRIEAVRPDALTASFVSWPKIHQFIVNGADVDEVHLPEDGDYGEGDQQVASAAVRLLRERDPDAHFVYFGNVDEAGHRVGYHPETSGYMAALEAADALVGKVLAAVRGRASYAREDWLILVCTDHGGQGTGHSGGHDDPQVRLTPLIVSGPSAARGELAGPVYLVDVPVTALVHLGVAIDPAWKLDGRPVGLLDATE